MEETNYNLHLEAVHRNLKCSLINHIWLFILVTVLNIIIYIKIYFLYLIYNITYLIIIIIFSILIFIPLYPLFLIIKQQKLMPSQAKLWRKLSLIISIFVIIFGILINVIIFLGVYDLFTFYKDCPYNFSYKDISNIFNINFSGDIYKNIEYSDLSKCNDYRCLLIHENTENSASLIYLCNFDSSLDFEKFADKIYNAFFSKNVNQHNNQVKCKYFNEDRFGNAKIFGQRNQEDLYTIMSYYKICSSVDDFYECVRIDKPKEYDIDYNFSCPTVYDNIIVFFLGLISLIFNFLVSIVINIFEFIKFKYLYEILINIHTDKVSTQQSSKNSNQIRNDCGNENNSNINNEINSRTIIIEGNPGKNESIINNKNKENNESLLTIKTKISSIRKEFEKADITERQNIKFGNTYEQSSKNKNSDNASNNSIHFININFDNSNKKFKAKKSLYNLTESKNI